MNGWRRLLLPTVVLSLLASSAAAQEGDAAAENAARELLEVSGAGQMGVQVMEQMVTSFRASMPDVPKEFWDEFLADADPDDLVEMTVPIYVKHLTAEEMEAAVAFYRSPAGQAILDKMPLIVQESMAAGQQWGMELGLEVRRRLEEREAGDADSTVGDAAVEDSEGS